MSAPPYERADFEGLEDSSDNDILSERCPKCEGPAEHPDCEHCGHVFSPGRATSAGVIGGDRDPNLEYQPELTATPIEAAPQTPSASTDGSLKCAEATDDVVANDQPLPEVVTSDLKARFSVISATNPTICTKTFRYTCHFLTPERRTLHTGVCAEVYEGSVETRAVTSLRDFAACLTSLQANQCIVYGVPPRSPVGLITESKWRQAGQPVEYVARTKSAFSWPTGPGVLMLDYDAPKDGTPALPRHELVAAIRTAVPGLADVAMLWWPSTSSLIFDRETGEQIRGLRGQRLYILVQDATDIERAGKAIVGHLWARGHGRFEVSKSGALLERGMFDASVWQSNRIDFAAGAACTSPLEQRRGKPIEVPGASQFADTRAVIADPTPDICARAEAAKAAARGPLAAESERIRSQWVETRTADIVARAPAVSIELAREQTVRAIEQGILGGDWQLVIVDRGLRQYVSIIDALDNPGRYHGGLTLDPIEPDYDGGRAVGKLYLYGARPRLHSFAHGGRTYKLERQQQRIELVRGRERESTDALLELMRRAPDVYDFGSDLVSAGGGSVFRFDEYSLRHWVGGMTQFWAMKKTKDGQVYEVLENPPATVCRTVLALGTRRELRRLTAILTAPTLRSDGTVLSEAGYDADTGFLLEIDEGSEAVAVPAQPTSEQAHAALRTLWTPFEKFPFVRGLDRAAHLAAILTAVVRPSLPTVPAFAYDAPVQGSGKTLLARCIAALAVGTEPDVWSATAGRDDEEMRKRLFSALREGKRVVVLDNLIGDFDSASLAAALTSPNWSDRILGKSEVVTVSNKTVFVLNGNNMSVSGDMTRRVLTCRIDPETDTPFARQFDLAPVQYCLANRQAMIAATLTLIRYYLSSGAARPASGRMASFEDWDDWVRQTIVFVDRELAPGQFGDVMDLVKVGQASDPDQESLIQVLLALREVFGDEHFSAADVARACVRGEQPVGFGQGPTVADKAIADVMSGFRNGREPLTAKSVGRILRSRKDRIAGGMRLEGRHDTHTSVMQWRVHPNALDQPAGFAGFAGFDSSSLRVSSQPSPSQGKWREINAANQANQATSNAHRNVRG